MRINSGEGKEKGRREKEKGRKWGNIEFREAGEMR